MDSNDPDHSERNRLSAAPQKIAEINIPFIKFTGIDDNDDSNKSTIRERKRSCLLRSIDVFKLLFTMVLSPIYLVLS